MNIFDLKKCIYCDCNLDGGDIYEVLRNLEAYTRYTDDEIIDMAKSYGWTENNKLRFSNLIGMDMKYQCPECKKIITLK